MSNEPAMEEDSTAPRIAPEPFDDASADLVLRSCDKVDFHVHRAVLRLSSTVFASMLSLPQPAAQGEQGVDPADNAIEVSDDSKGLYKLLSWMDPRGALHFSDLQDAAGILMLAEKYDLEAVKGRLLSFVYAGRQSLKQNPNELFALGRRFRHTKLADFAALESLRFPVTKWADTPLLDLITGRDHQALMLYFFHCQRVAKSVVKDWLQWTATRDFIFKTTWSGHHCTFKPLDGSNHPDWWIQYLDAVTRALWDTPSAHVLNTVDIFTVTAPASMCSKCKPRYASDLQSFNSLLANKLEVIIPRFSIWLSEQSQAGVP